MSTLIVFAKIPQTGKVKTRLGKDIGHEKATELYRCFLLDAVEQYSHLTNTRVVFYFSPEEHQPEELHLIPENYKIKFQRGNDLGERMLNAIKDEIHHGPCLIVGSDHPNLPTQYLKDGLEYLNAYPNSIVIGRSEDGGYYTIGMNKVYPEIFQNMVYSNEDVYTETVTRITENNINSFDLPTWYDIDSLDDVRKLVADLTNPLFGSYQPNNTLRFLRHDKQLIELLGEELDD